MKNLITSYSDVFAKGLKDFGIFKLDIYLTDDIPFRQKPMVSFKVEMK